MKLPKFIRENLLLKMTSLNAVSIVFRLIISLFVNREITRLLGEGGYSRVGNFRNVLAQLTSFTSLGVFNGVVKYISEHKNDKEQLQKLFSTTFVFTVTGSIIAFATLFFFAEPLSNYYFGSLEFVPLLKFTAVIVPFISIQRVFSGVINGLSLYKKFVVIEIVGYVLSTILTLILLYKNQLDGVLFSIALTPIIQVVVMLFLMIKVLKEYVQFKKLKWKTPLFNSLIAFTAMSFFSTILVNQVEIELRNILEARMGAEDADVWTGLNYISKNYMVFSSSLISLYVIPKLAGIYFKVDFFKELKLIYKTLLPLFALGMFGVYLFKEFIVSLIFVGDYYKGMIPLFKWQLLGDFIRLASVILATQFIAKKMVYNFIFTELFSLILFYGFAYYFIDTYGVEGVTIAHFLRYILYFLMVYFLIVRNFRKKAKSVS